MFVCFLVLSCFVMFSFVSLATFARVFLFRVGPFCFAVLVSPASVCWLLFVCLSVRWLRCSTSLPGGNQVDGLPPASQ